MTKYMLSISTQGRPASGTQRFFGRIHWRCRRRREDLERDLGLFDPREELIEFTRWMPGDILLVGSWGETEPTEVLAGDPLVVARAQALYARAVEIDFWERPEHAAEMTQISAQWDELVEG